MTQKTLQYFVSQSESANRTENQSQGPRGKLHLRNKFGFYLLHNVESLKFRNILKGVFLNIFHSKYKLKDVRQRWAFPGSVNK